MQEQLLMWWKQFRNICLCNLHSIFPIYIYPPKILPKKHFKFPFNTDELSKKGSFAIIRRSNKSKGHSFDSLGFVREDAIISKPSELPSLSMNILGGEFKPNHLNYKAKGAAIKNWEVNEPILLVDFMDDWEFLEDSTPIYFPLKDIHIIEFPYERNVGDKETKKLMAAFSFLQKEEKARFYGKTSVEHEPVKLNYWHVELKLKDVEGNTVKKADSAWKKSAAESALNDILLVKALPYIQNFATIPKEFYS